MADRRPSDTDHGAASGRQTELRHGDQRAVVVEVGGGLREYWHGDRPVLDGYGTDEVAPDARGQLLIPWPNRLHDGRYSWDGTSHTVPMDEPDQQNALHGLTRWRSWTAEVGARLRGTGQPDSQRSSWLRGTGRSNKQCSSRLRGTGQPNDGRSSWLRGIGQAPCTGSMDARP